MTDAHVSSTSHTGHHARTPQSHAASRRSRDRQAFFRRLCGELDDGMARRGARRFDSLLSRKVGKFVTDGKLQLPSGVTLAIDH